jgi:hypothetical protein
MAKAAYRSGECLYDERNGQFHDYTGGAERVMDTWVMARDNAPAWMQHAAREARQRAWNEAERAEPRANGRIATELVVGLPHELTNAQRKELLSAFVLRIVEKHGVFADVAIHTAHDERNIHAHILLSHRELGPDGFGDIANRRTVLKKVKGKEKETGIAGIAATPVDIKKLREQWAQDVNRAYERAGLPIRVDHRSFEDRGIKDVPTIHLGPKAAAMERAGKYSDRGDINRIIQFGNAELRQLEAEKQRQDAHITDFQKALAERLAQQQPRKDEAEKNYSKQQGGEIPPQPKDQAMPDEQSPPANENLSNPPPGYRIGASVPISFGGPESRAAYDPAEHLDSSTPPPSSPELDEQRKAEAAAKVREAWQQPAFSLDSIRADPWTAVYLATPENASPILLNEAYNAAGRCIEAVDYRGREYADAAPHGPLFPQGDEADNRAKAEVRRDELQAQLFPIGAPAAEQPQRERTAFLEATAHDAAREITGDDFFVVGRDDVERQALQATPEPVRNDPVRTLRPSEPSPGRYDQLKVEIASEARPAPNAAQPAAKAPEIDLQALQSPDPIAAPTAQPETATPLSDAASARMMRFEAQQGMAQQEAVIERIQEAGQGTTAAAHAAVDKAERFSGRVLGWLADRFSSGWHAAAEFLGLATEPKMTAAQVHDTLQANVGNLEKDHAEGVDAAQRETETARDWQQHDLKSAQQEKDLRLAQALGTNPTAEANLNQHDRERDRGRDM